MENMLARKFHYNISLENKNFFRKKKKKQLFKPLLNYKQQILQSFFVAPIFIFLIFFNYEFDSPLDSL